MNEKTVYDRMRSFIFDHRLTFLHRLEQFSHNSTFANGFAIAFCKDTAASLDVGSLFFFDSLFDILNWISFFKASDDFLQMIGEWPYL